MSDMTEATNRYIEQEEKRTTLYDDALGSWRDCEETGEHITLGEARSWLQKAGMLRMSHLNAINKNIKTGEG